MAEKFGNNMAQSDDSERRTRTVVDNADSTARKIQKHIDRGLELYRKGQVHDALVDFLNVLAIDPLDPLGHYLCGLSFQALNLDDMAINEWAAASSFSVRDGQPWDSNWEWIKNKSNALMHQQKANSLRRVH